MQQLTQMFFRLYFLVDTFVGRSLNDERVVFDKLYKVFLLSEKDKKKLFEMTQREEVSDIKTYSDYERVCRIKEYSELAGVKNVIPDELVELITIKGQALKDAKELGRDESAFEIDITNTAVCNLLMDNANRGLIMALCTLGFLHCEGLYSWQNKTVGLKLLERAAKWNSFEGILLALYYDSDNRRINFNRIYTVMRDTPLERIITSVSKAYGLDNPCVEREAVLIAAAFSEDKLDARRYSPNHARFIYSRIIEYKDKINAIGSKEGKAISEFINLPLNLAKAEIEFDSSALKLPVERVKEERQIGNNIANADLRFDKNFHPLCITSESEYLRNLYIERICSAFPSARVVKIEVADLTPHDVEPAVNNVFIRSCDEDKQNIYVLHIKGEVSSEALNAVKNFIQSEKRARFFLAAPNTVVDMGAILPICVCDAKNAAALRMYCDVVTVAPVSEEEKHKLLEYALREKTARYKMSDVIIDADAERRLCEEPIDAAILLLDKVLQANRKRTNITVSSEMLGEFLSEINGNIKFGFGGVKK